MKYLGADATIPELQAVDFPFWLFLIMPLYFAAVALRKKRIRERGVIRKAKLLSLAPIYSYGMRFYKTRFEACYAFSDGSGREAFGKSLTTDLVLLNEKKKGDEVEILMLPEKSEDSLILDAEILKCLIKQ